MYHNVRLAQGQRSELGTRNNPPSRMRSNLVADKKPALKVRPILSIWRLLFCIKYISIFDACLSTFAVTDCERACFVKKLLNSDYLSIVSNDITWYVLYSFLLVPRI